MSAVRLIPCLDVCDGRVVKGVRFQNLRDAGDPAELAARYEAEGADEIVLLDVSATPDGRATAAETVRRVRTVLGIPLTVGGGVRRLDDAARLLEAGADKIGVNTAAVERPALVRELAERFGTQCVVTSIDAAQVTQESELVADAASGGKTWELVVRSGVERTGRDAVDWAREVESLGAGEILLTSWDRDGTRAGYDTELLASVARAVDLPIVASGGAAAPADLIAACEAGAQAVLAASMFHDGDWSIAAVKQELLLAGVRVRPPDGAQERQEAAS